MFDLILSVAISFAITLLAIPVIIFVAEKKKLFDVPDERKVHAVPIPSLGGLGIFAGFIVACLICVPFESVPEFQFFVAAAMVIFFLGLKDDILDISPLNKFIGQVLAAFLLVYKGGVQLKSMHGFLGVYELPEMMSLLLTYFTIIVIINSFNLIDGVDGLAGSLGIMATTVLGIYFLRINLAPYAILSFSLAGSLVAFLIYNYQPAKIFMGDTGSLLIGLISAILVIKFINMSASSNPTLRVTSSPAVGFAVLMIPLLDTLRVFGIRIIHRRSPFSPDRNHIHHLLLDKGLSHRNVTLTLVAINLVFIALSYFGRSIGVTMLLLSLISLFFTMIGVLYYTRPKKHHMHVTAVSSDKKLLKGSSKIILANNAVLEEE